MIIRQERTADHQAVYELIREAFLHAPHRDGNEQDLAAALRQGQAFIPALSLVAEDEGELVGHVLFTRLAIGDTVQLALAPLSVRPDRQGEGIGAALVQVGHQKARELGFSYSVVLGDPAYYSRFGYVPADTYGIHPPFTVDRPYFMAVRLDPQAAPADGAVQYAPEFGI